MAMSVSFGETPAFDIAVQDENTLTCTVPAATAAGTVDVTVASSTSSDVLADGYTYAVVPEITSVNPDTAPVGEATFYTVNGNNLPGEADPQAWFVSLEPDGDPIALDVTYTNGFPTFSLTAENAGTYDLWVEDGSGTELARLNAAVEITAPVAPPTLDAVSPGTGVELDSYNNTLTGTGLSQIGPNSSFDYGLRLTDGTVTRTVSSVRDVTSDGTSGTLLFTSMPPGTFDMELYERASGTVIDTITDAVVVTEMTNPPVLTSIDPTSGPVGTAVTLTGTNLGTTTIWSAGLIDDDGDLRSASSVVRTATQWTGSVGTGDYTNDTAYDVVMWWSYSMERYVKSTLPAAFTVVEVVQSVEPAVVPPNTSVELTVTGEDLDQYTDWHVRLDPDEGTVGAPRSDVPVGGFVVLSEAQVQFSVTLPVQGAYHIVAIDPAGSTVVLGFDKVTADPSAEVAE